MNNPDLFPDRLREAIGAESVRTFALRCGISEGAIRKYLASSSEPGMSALTAIAKEAGVTIAWLATGEGPMRHCDKVGSGTVAEVANHYASAKDLEAEYSLVPRYDVAASAGHGSIIHSEQVVDHLAFKTKWLRGDMGLEPDKLALITAKGDSMEPTIRDRDLLLVDTREKPVSDGVYVLRLEGSLIAKRIQRDLQGGLIVRSDNPAYPELRASKDQVGLLEIVGRIVWTGGRL